MCCGDLGNLKVAWAGSLILEGNSQGTINESKTHYDGMPQPREQTSGCYWPEWVHQNRAILCSCRTNSYRQPRDSRDFMAPRCAISLRLRIASERRSFLRFKLNFQGTKPIPTVEFPAMPESAVKMASEWRCVMLVHSATDYLLLLKQDVATPHYGTAYAY